MKKLSLIAGSVAITTLAAIVPLAAFAQTADAGVTTTVGTPVVSVSAKGSASLTKGMARADQEITRRITNLNSASARIAEAKTISSSEKSSIQANLSTEIGNLTSLKAKIDADTDASILKTDVQSITVDYRVYLLVLPQTRILAGSDRVSTIVSDMQTLAPKLETRITAAQNAGKNVNGAESAYTDMQAKIADANTQSSAAVSETASLTPDQGNATTEASNKVAVKDAAAKIKVATTDLKAARADIKTIESAVKGVGASATASTTVVSQ
jgi:hypothetical protein